MEYNGMSWTLSEFIMQVLTEYGPMKSIDISNKFNVKYSSVSSTLTTLKQQGAVLNINRVWQVVIE